MLSRWVFKIEFDVHVVCKKSKLISYIFVQEINMRGKMLTSTSVGKLFVNHLSIVSLYSF